MNPSAASPPGGSVFISYRRGDSAGHTGRLLDSLDRRLGRGQLFRDIEDLEAGVDFPLALETALASCRVMLVVIGTAWSSAANERGRRIMQDNDWVRSEIATGLVRPDVMTIPVLVNTGLVELASVADRDGVALAVASVFRVQPQAGRSWRDLVVDALRSREVLLVIDNYEHVLDEVAGLVEAIVGSCPMVRVLVTSRESLGMGAEWAWRVPSLPVGEGSVASALFIERADHAASGFVPDPGDAAVIAEICARLDGIPLAIELAAARVRSMSPTQIRDRLDERFRLLTGSRRSIERHQTLRHAVQWSYDLLDTREQRALQRVSVFSGGFTLAGAVAVCAADGLDEFDTLDVLDSLVAKSLVDLQRSDADVRYAMLETIHQFAEEALAAADDRDADATRDVHAGFFADQADIALRWAASPNEAHAYRFVDNEIANLSAAFRWSVNRGLVDAAVRIATTAHRLARIRLRTETFGWCEEVLGLARAAGHRRLPSVLAWACDSATAIGRAEDAARFGREAVALNDDDRFDVDVLVYAQTGFALMTAGDMDGCLAMFRMGAEHPADREARSNLGYLHAIAGLAGVRFPDEEIEQAVVQLAASVVPNMQATAFWVQALNVAETDIAAAIALYQQAIDMAANVGCRLLEETCRGFQLGLLANLTDVDAALAGFTARVNAWQVMGDFYAGPAIIELASLLARLGHHDGAARLWGAVAHGASADELARLAPSIPTVRDAMGPVAFTIAYEAGALLDPRSSGQLAHQLVARARVDHAGL